jgi:hypothetical protein
MGCCPSKDKKKPMAEEDSIAFPPTVSQPVIHSTNKSLGNLSNKSVEMGSAIPSSRSRTNQTGASTASTLSSGRHSPRGQQTPKLKANRTLPPKAMATSKTIQSVIDRDALVPLPEFDRLSPFKALLSKSLLHPRFKGLNGCLADAPLQDLLFNLPLIYSIAEAQPDSDYAVAVNVVIQNVSCLLSCHFVLIDSFLSFQRMNEMDEAFQEQLGFIACSTTEYKNNEDPAPGVLHELHPYTVNGVVFFQSIISQRNDIMEAGSKGDSFQIAPDLTVFHPFLPARRFVKCFIKAYDLKEKSILLDFEATEEDVFERLPPLPSAVLTQSDWAREAYGMQCAFELMNSLWARAKLSYDNVEVRAHTLQVLPISETSLLQVQLADSISFADFPHGTMAKYPARACNFVASAAAMFVACFVLSIKFRDESSFLIHKNGSIFLQYFGSVLNHHPYAKTFKVTKKIESELGERYEDFLFVCHEAYKVLLTQRVELTQTLSTILAGLSVERMENTASVLQESLLTSESEENALNVFRESILELSAERSSFADRAKAHISRLSNVSTNSGLDATMSSTTSSMISANRQNLKQPFIKKH